jgi:hypothetical protein
MQVSNFLVFTVRCNLINFVFQTVPFLWKANRLHFRLSPFISLGSCNHCNLVCFLWSNNFEHHSWNHWLCFFSSWWPGLCLAEILIFPLIVSQTLLLSPSACKFFKAVNLFEISTRYCSSPCTSFNFLRLNLSTWTVCVGCLLIHWMFRMQIGLAASDFISFSSG